MTSLGPSIRGTRAVKTPVRLAWRVGASGKLAVELEFHLRPDQPFAPLDVAGSWQFTRAGRTDSGSIAGTGAITPTNDGSDVEIEADLQLVGLPASRAAALAIARARSTPVVLTDLPAALGLPGGTYVLEDGSRSHILKDD